MKKILVISGSLRVKSFNTALARALQHMVPEGVSLEYGDISTLPLYNADLEENFPESAQALKNQIESADALVFVTPEYNRSIPGVLKNAIDWASRPWGKNSFACKHVLVMGASNGAIATAVGQQDLKKVMLHLDAQVMGQPELFIGTAQDKFNEAGDLIDEKTRTYVQAGLTLLISRI